MGECNTLCIWLPSVFASQRVPWRWEPAPCWCAAALPHVQCAQVLFLVPCHHPSRSRHPCRNGGTSSPARGMVQSGLLSAEDSVILWSSCWFCSPRWTAASAIGSTGSLSDKRVAKTIRMLLSGMLLNGKMNFCSHVTLALTQGGGGPCTSPDLPQQLLFALFFLLSESCVYVYSCTVLHGSCYWD